MSKSALYSYVKRGKNIDIVEHMQTIVDGIELLFGAVLKQIEGLSAAFEGYLCKK